MPVLQNIYLNFSVLQNITLKFPIASRSAVCVNGLQQTGFEPQIEAENLSNHKQGSSAHSLPFTSSTLHYQFSP